MEAHVIKRLAEDNTLPVLLPRPATGVIAALFFGYLAVGNRHPVPGNGAHSRLRRTDYRPEGRQTLRASGRDPFGAGWRTLSGRFSNGPFTHSDTLHCYRRASDGRVWRKPVRDGMRVMGNCLRWPSARRDVYVVDWHRNVCGTFNRCSCWNGLLSALQPRDGDDCLYCFTAIGHADCIRYYII